MNEPQDLTTEQAAALLGIHRVNLMRLVREGRLKPQKAGNRLSFSRADLDAYRRRKCPQCGKAFDCARADQIFCAHPCAVAAADDRKRNGTSKPRPRPPAKNPAPVPDRLTAALRLIQDRRQD